MNEQFFYRKISKNNYTEKLYNNQKYSSRLRPINNTVLNSKLKFSENDISDCKSLNKISSECYDSLSTDNKRQKQNRSNIIPNHKLTYVLTSNDKDDKNSISLKNIKKINYIKSLINKAKKDLNTEPKKYENYSSHTYEEDNEKRAFSNKLKVHRENLNKLVKSLNEENNMNKITDILNDETDKYELKENINFNNNLNYINKSLDNENNCFNNIESEKCLTGAVIKNKFIKKRDQFNTYTYNNNQKSNKNKNYKGILEIKLNKTLNKNVNHRLLANGKDKMKSLTSDNINEGKNHFLKKEKLYKIPTESSCSNNIINNNININNNNNNNRNKEEENKKINLLRNEYNAISDNYLQISKQIDSLKGEEMTYEDIIKNNCKTKDILNYNYKNNNDIENEKLFILIKLKLKNSEIMINKLEQENKIYKKKFKKFNYLIKKNKGLTEDNNSLKDKLNDMNINYHKLSEELHDYENKFANINSFNKKIQEINRGLMNENCDLKRNYEISKKEYKDFKINYDKIIPQQAELIKKLEKEKNETIQKLEEKNNYLNEENNNLKILLENNQSKYTMLEQNFNELKNKQNKMEENINNINSKKGELQILNTNLNEENKILKEKNNELEKIKNQFENKFNEDENKYNNLLNEFDKIINENQINNKEKENNYNNLLSKYNNISTKYNTINLENEGLKNELIKQKEIFNIIENKYNKLKNKESDAEKNMEDKINNEIKKLNDIIKEKDEIMNNLNQKCDNYVRKFSVFKDMDKNLDEIKNNGIKLNEEKNKIENSYNELKKENNKLKTNYKNLQNDFISRSQSLNDIQDKKNKCENKNKELIKLIDELKHNLLLKDKEISNLNETIKHLNEEISNNKNKNTKIYNNNNKRGLGNNNNNNNNEKSKLFNELLSKYAAKDIKQSKIKMIIGLYLQKQKIEYEKKIQLCNEKNERLARANKKLNDKIIEYKFNNLNGDNSENTKSQSNEESLKNKGTSEQYYYKRNKYKK